MSKRTIDVKGLACPEPLLAFTDAAKNPAVNMIEISFDCSAAQDNITRAATSGGWTIDSVNENSDHTVMILTRNI